MPPQHRFRLHNKKRIAPTGEPSTGANPELPVRIAQGRLRAPALQHQQLLAQAQVLGNQQRFRPESGRNSPDEKANHPAPPTSPRLYERGQGSRLSTLNPMDGHFAPHSHHHDHEFEHFHGEHHHHPLS
jgi:hypothetical protein